MSNRKDILQNYYKNGLVLDVYCLLVLLFIYYSEIFNFSPYFSFLAIGILLKFKSFNNAFNQFEDAFLLKPHTQLKISLIKLLSNVLYIAHILACVWLILSKQEIEME